MEYLGLKLGGMEREIACKPGAIESNVNSVRQLATIADERQITTAEAITQAATNNGDRERESPRDFKLISAIAISLLLIIGSLLPSWSPELSWISAWFQNPAWQWCLATPIQFWCARAFVIDVWTAILVRRHLSTHRSIHANVNALVALATGTAYLYSLVSTFAPQFIARSNFIQPHVYYAISTMTIVLMFVGRKLEYLAKERSLAVISQLVERQLPIGSIPVLDRSLALVDRVQVNRLPISRLADRVTNKYIIPFVAVLAIVTSLAWSISIDRPTSGVIFGCSVLIITCPCVLGLATALAMAIGINKAAQREILVNNSNALELLSQAKTIVFDKNATVVPDRLAVTDFLPIVDNYNGTELDIFQLVASLEAYAKNIVASAIVDRSQELAIFLKPVDRFEEIAGKGIQGIIDGKLIQVGSNEWINSLDIDNVFQIANQRVLTNYQHQWESAGKTVIWIAIDSEIAGIIGIGAAIESSTIATISRLKRAGLEVVLIATDNLTAAKNLADRLRIDRVFACKDARDKVAVIQKLQSRAIGKYRAIVAMVGSSLNDASALAQADVSMAIGTSGNLPLSFCDLTLVNADLQTIITAIKLSRSTLYKIEQNLFFTFIYNLICLPIAAGIFYPQFGFSLTPQIAIGTMGMSLTSVVINSWRSRKLKN
ncbi:HAD-IC family P-type ATPase [Chamaesiphon polymorphus]|uniref:Heavy metal translocating P-type ATPase n=1 Tax=Chamaesiphon polymorphus CCALA 037 TaxID=2107692 RepID=A0A2T1GKM5_9CYAN|nr:HAD-IC family P-type ATPase [Chamaesiphon polymorphus]PSB58407.1 hypothetical protein C7B77_04830 [Chamaesiphon polymorphus CCALA 037]